MCVYALIAVVLSGCAISQITSPFRSRGERGGWATSVSEERLLEAAKNDTSSQVDLPARDQNCPRFSVWQRDRMLTFYEKGRRGDQLAIKYRGELTKTARECNIGRNKISVKYGYAGRVLLGQRGQPGTLRLPLRIHVTDASRNIISSQTTTVSVNVAPGSLVGYFSAVGKVSFAIESGTSPSQYQLYVAFDRNAAGSG